MRAALALTWLLLASPAGAWTYTVERTTTADGVSLGFMRLSNPGGTPVLLAHGICSNAYEFNLPGRSFAGYLADQGYDVWCLNFRHAGGVVPLFASDGPAEHDFDDLVALDLPAAIAAVRQGTGQRPFIIGHSLGGMVSLAWAQGCRRERVVTWRWGPIVLRRGDRIVADAGEAARRATLVRGIVALASPARFTWPTRDPFDYWNSNLLLQYLAWSPSATAATLVTPSVPVSDVARAVVVNDLSQFPHLGPDIQPDVQRAATFAGRTFLVALTMKPNSIDGQVLADSLALCLDDAPVPIFRQFTDGIRRGDMREAHVLDRSRRPHSYADGHRLVQAPVLWVAGRQDKLANEEAILATVAGMTSPDVTAVVVDHGHVDMVFGDTTPADVWAPVAAWLAAR